MARCGVVSVRVTGVDDFAALGARWRDLEQRSDGSFFQSWTWVGCLAAERFPDAVLVEAIEAGRTVALGLFNRVRRWIGPSTLYLAESGTTDLDSPYVEQNGILTEAGHSIDLGALCLHKLLTTRDVVLSGVGEAAAASVQHAASLLHITRQQPSWFVDLGAIRRADGDYLAGRSANTRQQLRRSNRFYERDGPIALTHADSVEAAHAMLDQMADLHQATWEGRGKPGSFASRFFRRFHHAMIEAALPRGEVTVIKISSGETIIGFLYNFIWRGRMSAYQSGFAYRDNESRAKPGLTCHCAAIIDALSQDVDIYDFLAGDDRYKRSLADRSHQQFWLEAGPFWSMRLLSRAFARRVRPRRPMSKDFTASTSPSVASSTSD
jgi:CelD/BcsL family acetyltransferase involved in cellulose biosynthesis